MSAPSWADLEVLFHEALVRAPADRAAFLAERCAGRPELRAEVEALLRAHASAASALEVPLVAPQTRLKTGMRVGPYEVLAELGAGGMGEVYRARDAKLGRNVALKILPLIFTSDPERLARFDREARMLAALSHPHIGAIYGFEESESIHALVLELIDGPTLADRLVKGPISVTEALGIATQIADALEAAHEKGIIHRDLKPANIKITSAGVVKVLDFGLAKLTDPAEAGHDASTTEMSASPTITVGGTRPGMILGTAAYMSPEQARGHVVDKRADIWAFGCVFYEMLTGRRAFPGETMSDTIAAILGREPEWTTLPESTPEKVRDVLRRCLRKDPKRRLHDIADARIEIEETLAAPSVDTARATSSPIMRPTSRWRRIAAFAAVALVAGSLTSIAAWIVARSASPAPRVSRFTITRSSDEEPGPGESRGLAIASRGLAIAPDGSRVVYSNPGTNNGSVLFVRAVDQLQATRLTGLGDPLFPFLSPDGQWIGFVDNVDDVLKKVSVRGGSAVRLSHLDGPLSGAAWGPEGTIVFATQNRASGLQQIPAAGGEATVLTRPNRAGGETDHVWPEFLPGGQGVLFTIMPTTGGLDAASIALLDLRTGAQTVLIRGGSDAHYVRSGHLVYGAAGTLRAVPFDLASRTVVGPPVTVVSQVNISFEGALNAVVADDGTLVYVPGQAQSLEDETLVWVDRQGREEPLEAPPRVYYYPRLSPDGTRLALATIDQERDIWLWDLARATLTRVTVDQGFDTFPVWTPDGRRLVFSSERAGARNLFAQAADGTGTIERLTETTTVQSATSISQDGAWLVFTDTMPGTGQDVMMLPLSGDRKPAPLIQTPFTERNGEISPDGRWIAYEANDSGRFEIYVRPFPKVMDGRWQVSAGGGTRPLWARNGQELFYRAVAPTATWTTPFPMGALMRVGVERGDTWAATAPVPLFEGRYLMGMLGSAIGRTYDVSPDGRRFLMIKPVPSTRPESTSIVVVQNWSEELKRLVPRN